MILFSSPSVELNIAVISVITPNTYRKIVIMAVIR